MCSKPVTTCSTTGPCRRVISQPIKLSPQVNLILLVNFEKHDSTRVSYCRIQVAMSNKSATADATAQAASRCVAIINAVTLRHESHTFRGALIKLLLFAVTLAILPISSYFISLRYMWGGAALLPTVFEHHLLHVLQVTIIMPP